MKKTICFGASCAFASAFALLDAAAATKPPPGPEAVTINAAEIKWGDAPPSFPKGAQMAALHGDPSKNEEFALRFKMPDGYKIAPHWHSKDEQLTVLSGTFILHMGDTMEAQAHNLDVGAYHYLPGKMHHAAQTKGEVILEIHGVGPLDIHYLNPADDPSKKAPAKAAAKK